MTRRSAHGPSHIFPGAGSVSEAAPEAVASIAKVAEPATVEVASAAPTWNASMKKADLFALAVSMNLPVTTSSTKAEILAALEGTAP